MSRPFRWTVVIEVSEENVADGLDFGPLLGDRTSLTAALHRAFPLARMSGLTAAVTKAPSRARIRKAQGYES